MRTTILILPNNLADNLLLAFLVGLSVDPRWLLVLWLESSFAFIRAFIALLCSDSDSYMLSGFAISSSSSLAEIPAGVGQIVRKESSKLSKPLCYVDISIDAGQYPVSITFQNYYTSSIMVIQPRSGADFTTLLKNKKLMENPDCEEVSLMWLHPNWLQISSLWAFRAHNHGMQSIWRAISILHTFLAVLSG